MLTCGNHVVCIPYHTASGRLHAKAVSAFCLVPGIKARLKRDITQKHGWPGGPDLRKSWLDVVKSDVGARAGKRQAVSPRLLAAAPRPLPYEAADLTRGALQARTKNRRSGGSCLTYFRI